MNRSFSLPFLIMGVVFCVCLICSNLLEVKMISLGGITATAGLIVFPISYIINDCIAEVWGYRKARLIIWLGFLMNLMAVIFPHLISKFHSFPCRLLFERLCHEQNENIEQGQTLFITSHYIDRSGRKCRFALVFSYRIRWSSSCKRTIDSHCNTSLP